MTTAVLKPPTGSQFAKIRQKSQVGLTLSEISDYLSFQGENIQAIGSPFQHEESPASVVSKERRDAGGFLGGSPHESETGRPPMDVIRKDNQQWLQRGLICWKKSLPLSSTRMKAGKSSTSIFQTASMPNSGNSTHSMCLMLFCARIAAGPPMEPK